MNEMGLNSDLINCVSTSDGYCQGNLNFVFHMVTCMQFIGWYVTTFNTSILSIIRMFFCFFGGIGFVSLPFDLIIEYQYRPKPIKEKDFTKRKHMLLTYTLRLRDMGKILDNERPYVATILGFTGYKKRRAFERKMRVYETRSLRAEREFQKL
jgi:LMBR1 domain-containing protein 1